MANPLLPSDFSTSLDDIEIVDGDHHAHPYEEETYNGDPHAHHPYEEEEDTYHVNIEHQDDVSSSDTVIHKGSDYESQFDMLIHMFEKVYDTLGPGYSEKIYEKAMGVDFRSHQVPYQTQVIIPIYYDGHNVGHHVADYLVYNRILVEIKAVKWTQAIKKASVEQLWRYIQTTHIKVGVVVNFGDDTLEYEIVGENGRIKEHTLTFVEGTCNTRAAPITNIFRID